MMTENFKKWDKIDNEITSFINNKDFIGLKEYLQQYNNYETDGAIIKVILIRVKPIKNNEICKELFEELVIILKKKWNVNIV